MVFRIEEDGIGKLDLPENVYYGIFSKRAKNNFPISKQKVNMDLIYSLVKVKLACAKANEKCNRLTKRKSNAIIKACNEILTGKFDYDIIVPNIQAGGSTPTNMNVNEVIANRAEEILGGKLGEYKIIHPNDDVNMSQSSNDTVPTAAIITTYSKITNLINSLDKIIKSFKKLSIKNADVIKVGRTHMEDAVPISFKQVFNSYQLILNKNIERLKFVQKEFLEIPLGGTAIGTQINTPQNYPNIVVKELSTLTKLKLKKDKNDSVHIQSSSQFIYLNSTLNALTSDIIRICENLILMNSGPLTGIGEIIMPEVEAGSSIMAGKVNPSICEATIMTCLTIQGNLNTTTVANQSSHLELNIYNPLIYDKTLESVEFLTSALGMLNEKAISKIKVNREKCLQLLDESLVYATILNPYLGYQVVEKIIFESLKEKKTLREKLIELKFFEEKYIPELFNPQKLLKSSKVNATLIKEIKKNENYKEYKIKYRIN